MYRFGMNFLWRYLVPVSSKLRYYQDYFLQPIIADTNEKVRLSFATFILQLPNYRFEGSLDKAADLQCILFNIAPQILTKDICTELFLLQVFGKFDASTNDFEWKFLHKLLQIPWIPSSTFLTNGNIKTKVHFPMKLFDFLHENQASISDVQLECCMILIVRLYTELGFIHDDNEAAITAMNDDQICGLPWNMYTSDKVSANKTFPLPVLTRLANKQYDGRYTKVIDCQIRIAAAHNAMAKKQIKFNLGDENSMHSKITDTSYNHMD